MERNFEDYAFQQPDNYPCKSETLKKGFFVDRSVDLAVHGNKTILITYNCRYSRLTLLDEELKVIWSKDITPQRSDFFHAYGNHGVVVTPSGKIMTLSRINQEEFSSLSERYNIKLTAKGEQDILVLAYDLDGKNTASAVVGSSDFDSYSQAVITEDTVYIIGESKVQRSTSVKQTQEDVFLTALRLPDLTTKWEKTIDLQNEDAVFAASIIANRYLAIGGVTGSLQVDTGSTTKHGDAFVMLTDLSGNQMGTKIFGSPRHDAVKTILDLKTDSVITGGYKDGPITHDGERDKAEKRSSGFIETFSLKELLRSP